MKTIIIIIALMAGLPAHAVLIPIEHPSGVDRYIEVEFVPEEIEKPLEISKAVEPTAEEIKLAELQDLINQLRALLEQLQAMRYEMPALQ